MACNFNLSRAVLYQLLSVTPPLSLAKDFYGDFCLMSSLVFRRRIFWTSASEPKNATQKARLRLVQILKVFLSCQKREKFSPPPPFALKTLAITLSARLPLVELYCRVATDCVRRRGGLSGFTWWWWCCWWWWWWWWWWGTWVFVELDEEHRK